MSTDNGPLDTSSDCMVVSFWERQAQLLAQPFCNLADKRPGASCCILSSEVAYLCNGHPRLDFQSFHKLGRVELILAALCLVAVLGGGATASLVVAWGHTGKALSCPTAVRVVLSTLYASLTVGEWSQW